MKLVLFIVGLVAMVPVSKKELIILIPDAPTEETIPELPVPRLAMPHTPEIAWHGQTAWKPEPIEGDLLFEDQSCSDEECTQIREGFDRIIRMSTFLGESGSGEVRKECIGKNGCRQAAARLYIKGGKITTGHVRFRDVKFRKDTMNTLVFSSGFTGIVHGPLRVSSKRKLEPVPGPLVEGTSAAIIELSVPKDFHLELSNKSIKLDETIPCPVPTAGQHCAFARIWNVPPRYLDECQSGQQCGPELGDYDTHFYHFYDLLKNQPKEPMLPRIAFMHKEAEGKPSIDCPYVILEPGLSSGEE